MLDASAALTTASFSPLAMFVSADWVVKLVMIGLILASLWSWAIILDKLVRYNTLNRQADRFDDAVGSGRSLDDIAFDLGDQPTYVLGRMLQGAVREWREFRTGAGLTDGQTALLINRIDRALDSLIARESRRVEDGLSLLAIVATSSPFVGLFGTVWGIMTAFQAIAVQRSTNLTVVAPAIAHALFATALGLLAAIPAYIAYNKLSTDAARYTGRLELFADDLVAAITRRLGNWKDDRLNGEAPSSPTPVSPRKT